MRALTALIVPLLAALALIGCGGGDDPRVLTATDAAFVPVLETTDLIVGDTRVVLTLLDRSEEPRFAANTTFRARFFEPTEGGIRFRPAGSERPWSIDASDQWGESHLVMADEADVDWA